MARNHKDPSKLLSSAVMLFYFSAFLLIACKDFAWQGFMLAVAVPAMIWIGTNLLPRLFPSDRLLLSLTNFLCALGVLVLYSTEPEYAYNQAMYYGIGIGAMIVCVWIVRLVRSWREHPPQPVRRPQLRVLQRRSRALGQDGDRNV